MGVLTVCSQCVFCFVNRVALNVHCFFILFFFIMMDIYV